MLFRILVGGALIVGLFFLYQMYGYRLVLDDIRQDATAETLMGSPRAPINILAYIDYDASWSRRAHPVLLQVLGQNPDVNILFKPLPGVSAGSELAARIALAARDKNRFLDVHSVFMESPGSMNEDYIEQVVEAIGLDYDELKSIAYTPRVTAGIEDAKRDALFLGINTTPIFYVEHVRLAGGGYKVADFEDIIRDLRSGRR